MVETHCSLAKGSLEHDAMFTVFGRVMIVVDPSGVPGRNEMFDARRDIHRVTHHPEGRPHPTVSSEEAFVRGYAAVALMLREETRGYRARIGLGPPSRALLMERDVLKLARAQAAELFRDHAGALIFEEFTSGKSPPFSSVVDVQRAMLPGCRLETSAECRALSTVVAGNRWYTSTVEELASRFGVEVHVPASVADSQRRWRP